MPVRIVNGEIIEYRQDGSETRVVSVFPVGRPVDQSQKPYCSGYSIAQRNPRRLQDILKSLKSKTASSR
jgi:hypothetical protein